MLPSLLFISSCLIYLSLLVGNCSCSALMSADSSSSSSSSKVALITGANKGIGKEIVRLLKETAVIGVEDWIIFLGSRDEDRGKEAVVDLTRSDTEDTPGNIICCQLDLTDDGSIQAAKQLVEERAGGKLDVLVNNAAICFNDPTLYGKVPFTPFEQQADITVRTNFFGTLRVTQEMLSLLQKSDSPRIINIASAAGRLAILKSEQLAKTFTSDDLQLPQLESLMQEFVKDVESGIHTTKGWPNTCYGMSKLGIIAMTRILAREYPSIMVNSVDPGYCATDQNNNQGMLPAEMGAVTPVLLATMPSDNFVSGGHFYQGQAIEW